MHKNVILKYKKQIIVSFINKLKKYLNSFVRRERIKRLIFKLLLHYYKIFRFYKKFTFKGKKYPYFYQQHNWTMLGERCVEVPIVWQIVKQYQRKKILEVGNVLPHYFPVKYDVIDKYEKWPGVINQDITDFKPTKRYDLIVSISTLEHIGWDEDPRRPEKVLKAMSNLKRLLAPGGQMIITIPLAFNSYLDQAIEKNLLGFKELYFLKRISADNTWKEVGWNEVRKVKYRFPYPQANGLAIGYFKKD